MPIHEYPYNLIRDIYKDSANIEERIHQVDVPKLYDTLNYLPEDEQIALRLRYQDGLTFKQAGLPIGESTVSTRQIVNRSLRRLRRFAEHNYYQINPDTGAAYTRDEVKPYIGELQLNTAAETALIRAGYSEIETVRSLSEDELKQIPNFGERHYGDYEAKIAQYEQQHGLTPYPKASYPQNLIRAIYGDNTPAEGIDVTGLEHALKSLSQQERLLIQMKYKDNYPIQDIAHDVRMQDNRISQVIQRGILKLKEQSRADYINPKGEPKTAKNDLKIKAVLQDVYPFNLIARILGDDNAYLRTAYLEGFHEEIKRLPNELRTFVRLRYEFGFTLDSCGRRLNKSPYEIEILERQTHRKLRDKKEDGLLTAIPKHQFVTVQQRNNELADENQSLKTLLQQVANGEIKADEINAPGAKEEEAAPVSAPDSIPIEDLSLSVRAYNALSINRWNTLDAITQHTRNEFKALRRVGATIEREIDQVLAAHGVSFRDETHLTQSNTN